MSIIRMRCLQERFIPFAELNKVWKWDKRYPEQAIQRFIAFNKAVFSFLGVSAQFEEVNYEKGLRLIASNFIGAAPLRNHHQVNTIQISKSCRALVKTYLNLHTY